MAQSLNAQFQKIIVDVHTSGGGSAVNQPVWVAIGTNPKTYLSGTTDSFGRFSDSIPSVNGPTPVDMFTFDCNQNYVFKSTVIDSPDVFVADTLVVSCAGNPPNCTAAFSSITDSAGKVDFTNNSTHNFGVPSSSINYSWNFGDGSAASTQINPTHTYSNPGYYVVSLTIAVHDSLDPNFVLKTDVVQQTIYAGIPVCNARFSQQVNDTTASFTNTSTTSGVSLFVEVSYRWDFGDGTFSNQVNPVHKFPGNGSYTVCLEQYAIDSSGFTQDTICSSSFCRNITIAVQSPLSCSAGFSYFKPTPNGDVVFFNDTSIVSSAGYLRSIKWDFGDGTTSTDSSVSHVFVPSAVPYNVCLSLFVRDSLGGDTICTDTFCDTISVPIPINDSCQASFVIDTINSFSGNVYIWNNSLPYTSDLNYQNSFQWDLGDGHTSNQAFPTHLYSGPGTYAIVLTLNSLKLSDGTNCQSTFSDTITVDSLGHLINKNGVGFRLIVLNPANIGLTPSKETEAAVFPNPAHSSLMVELDPAGRD
ncbi:MAG: PKD domain-containing protein, partial [Owenweeksia sp.]